MSDRPVARLGDARIARLFPHVVVVHEDADILVIDKQSGLSTSSGGDDVLARARAMLGDRGDRAPYVAAHAPLERDASGVLVLLKSRELNAELVKLISAGRMEVVYIAAGELVSRGPRARDGVRIVEQSGKRALVEAIGVGKRARAALHASGLAIAGDVERGGPVASRPMVHAREVRFPHPRSGEIVVASSPVPLTFATWLHGEEASLPSDAVAFRAALLHAAANRAALARTNSTTAFRLVHEVGDDLPGVAVDVYGAHALLHVSSPEAAAREAEIAEALVSLGFEGVYLKRRPKQANVLVDTRREDVAPAHAIAGADAPDPIVVIEHGDRFLARLGDGLSTGIFLDQRDNRALVKELSRGRTVLNLFAYACAFTVSAASGGATKTTSVDIAKIALATGEDNLREGGLADPARHRFVVDESRAFLERAKVRKDRFDLVILDPPSYATSKGVRFTALHDYVDLLRAAFEVLSPSGHLLACTNHRGIPQAKLRGFVREAASLAGRTIEQLRSFPPPFDFPPPPGGDPHLKTALASVR